MFEPYNIMIVHRDRRLTWLPADTREQMASMIKMLRDAAKKRQYDMLYCWASPVQKLK